MVEENIFTSMLQCHMCFDKSYKYAMYKIHMF
jgi:hypothetical protein